MGAASKSYNSQYQEGQFGKDLYWPDKKYMFDMLQMDVLEYVPISKAVSANTATEFTALTNIQSVDTVYNIVDGARKSGDRKTLNRILLPVPNDINYSDQLDWSTNNAGILGKMLPALAGAAASGQGDVGALISKTARGGIPEFLLSTIKALPGPMQQISSESLTQGIGGKILNPYVEQIFKGIGMREFNFSWKLVPRNSSEQSKIHNIIKALRYYSLPNYSTAGVIDTSTDPAFQNFEDAVNLKDRWLTVPNVFKLTWIQADTGVEIQSLPKIKPCVLKNIQVNYTPDNVWATHINTSGKGLSGPSPIAYNITISFAETEIITGHEVISGTDGGY
jgi:hypothetical protein